MRKDFNYGGKNVRKQRFNTKRWQKVAILSSNWYNFANDKIIER